MEGINMITESKRNTIQKLRGAAQHVTRRVYALDRSHLRDE